MLEPAQEDSERPITRLTRGIPADVACGLAA